MPTQLSSNLDKKAKFKIYNKTYREKNKDKIKVLKLSPKGKYDTQRTRAKARGISWELTFEEWWAIWEASGRWKQRGQRADQYCMARHKDCGPYSIDNVSIKTVRENLDERNAQHGWAKEI